MTQEQLIQRLVALVQEIRETVPALRSMLVSFDYMPIEASQGLPSALWVDRIGKVEAGELDKIASGLRLASLLVADVSFIGQYALDAAANAVLAGRREITELQKMGGYLREGSRGRGASELPPETAEEKSENKSGRDQDS